MVNFVFYDSYDSSYASSYVLLIFASKFLDTRMDIQKDGYYDTEVYRKETMLPIHLSKVYTKNIFKMCIPNCRQKL